MGHRYDEILGFRFCSFLLAVLGLALPFAAAAQNAGAPGGAQVIEATRHDVSPPLRSINLRGGAPVQRAGGLDAPENIMPDRFSKGRDLGVDPLLRGQRIRAILPSSPPIQNFDGQGSQDNLDVIGSTVAPPDPDIAVGDGYIVQMINLVLAVYDKQGNQVMASIPNNAIWNGFGGLCESNNNGDPIILYDQEAGRWILSQFAVNNARGEYRECVAVSTTSNPMGAYYRYAFEQPGFNDYPKLGVGRDAYYYSHNQFDSTSAYQGAVAGAFQRDSMLVGGDAAYVFFGPDASRFTLLPADIDGPPADDAPHPFAELIQDAVNLYELDVDFEQPVNSTFREVATLETAPYDGQLCTAARGACVPQPDGPNLESLAGVLMQRLQFRDMGTYNAMVTSHVVDVDGYGRGGVRWYEFRDDGSGWSVYQQGTYAPSDGNTRWMSSIAMNADGAIGLAYTVSGSDQPPAIRYTGRPQGAPLGEMVFAEESVIEGPTSQRRSSRWGDYSNVAVDPSDGQTFWATHEYGSDDNPEPNWDTRIASFAFDPDDETPPGAIADLTATARAEWVELTWTAPPDDAGDPASGSVAGYDIRFSTDGPIADPAAFADATPVAGAPSPAPPGTKQGVQVALDFATQYWLAVRAVDDNGNTALSNSASATTGSAPELAFAPDTLRAELEINGEAVVDLTLANEGPMGSYLNFTFPAFAAGDVLENTPERRHNDTTRSLVGSTEHAKRQDSYGGAGRPVVLGAGGPDGFGYEWIDSNEPGGPTYDFVDITARGTKVELGDDEGQVVPLPFELSFYGAAQSEVTISSNGYLTFGGDGTDFSNDPMPSAEAPNAIVAPFWDDLHPGRGGAVHYYDDAENNRFIVQYTDVPRIGGAGTCTFQVVLNAGGSFLYQYQAMEGDTLNSATVGIENAAGDAGLQVAFNTDYVEDSLAIAIAARPDFIADVSPASGEVAGGQQQAVDVTFSATGIEEAGFFEEGLALETNDPEQQLVAIPAEADVATGDPNVAVRPLQLDYGDVMLGATAHRSFFVVNEGAGPLQVTGISVSDPAFQPSFGGPATVGINDSLEVGVAFQPTDLQTYTGTATVETSDPDDPAVSVELIGAGTPPPVIAVRPDSLEERVPLGQTATDTLTLSNNGGSDLEYLAYFEEDTARAAPSEVAAPAPRSYSGQGADPEAFSRQRRSPSTAPAAQAPEDAEYRLDDGTAEFATGLSNGGDVMWLNSFEALGGQDQIREVATTWGAPGDSLLLPAGKTATALVYDDPNNDGDPADAALLAETPITVTAPNTNTFTTAAFEGGVEVNGTFFVAILYPRQAAERSPVPLDVSSAYQRASWLVGHTTPGGFNKETLSANDIPPVTTGAVGWPGNVLLRADAPGSAVPYLSVTPDEGTLSPGTSEEVIVAYTARDEQAARTYTGEVIVENNDPAQPRVGVPTRLDITTAPYPFALSPGALEVTIDRADQDTTNDRVTRAFTVENTTEDEQSFFIETVNVAGQAPIFQNFRTAAARRDFARRQQRAAAGHYPKGATAPSLGPAPGSRWTSAPPRAEGRRLVQASGRTAYSTSLLGAQSGQFVQFDLGMPGTLSPFGPSPIALAGDFAPGDDEAFYVIEDGSHAFLKVDKATGATTPVGTAAPAAGQDAWTELAGDPTDGTLYGVSSSASASVLYTIDEETATVTEVGAITLDGGPAPFVIAVAIDGNGRMYGYNLDDRFLEIDKDTGAATVVGPIGFDANFAQGMDYDLRSGTLYMAAFNAGLGRGELRTVNPETGMTTLVGPLGAGDALGYLSLPSGGFLFINVDLLAGTLAPGGDVTIDANIDADGLLAGAYHAAIRVFAEVPGTPVEAIPVDLEVLGAPEARLEPMALDFGAVFVGGDSTRSMVLTNTGIDDLEVSGVTIDGNAFALPDTLDPGFALAPGEARVLPVTFGPGSVGTLEGALTVASNDPGGPVTASLTGEGIPAPAAAVRPDAFALQAYPGQTYERTLALSNTGGSPLTYTIRDTLRAAPGARSGPAPEVTFEDVLFEEDFEEGLPDAWTVLDNTDADSPVWQSNAAYDQANFVSDGTAAHADSDVFGPAAFDTELRTPAMTAPSDEYVLAFKMNYQNFAGRDTLDVDLSTDGGQTWTSMARYIEDRPTSGFLKVRHEKVSLSLAPFVDRGDTFQVRWRYHDTAPNASDLYAQIDDVRISRELAFLTVDPRSGTVAPGTTDSIAVRVDAANLSLGTYEVALDIATNDPTAENITVPITLDVIGGVAVGLKGREVYPSQQFLVPVEVQTPKGLGDLEVESYQFTVAYPDSLLTALGVQTDGTLSEENVAVEVLAEEPGRLTVLAADMETGAPGGASKSTDPAEHASDEKPAQDTGPPRKAPSLLFTIEEEGSRVLIFLRMRATGEALGEAELAFTDFMFNEGALPLGELEPATVRVAPLYGDATLNGEVTQRDGREVLAYALGLIDLMPVALTSADVSGNGKVTAFDAALIYSFLTGHLDCFPVEAACSAKAMPALANASSSKQAAASGAAAMAGASAGGTLAWGPPKAPPADGSASGGAGAQKTHAVPSAGSAGGALMRVPLHLETNGGSVRALHLSTDIDLDKVSVEGIESQLPDRWHLTHHTSDAGTLTVTAAGPLPLSSGPVATLALRWLQPGDGSFDRHFSLAGRVALNEASPQTLANVQVSAIPEEFAVSGNYPNPFSRSTKIAVNLPTDADVSLELFDALGRRVMRAERKMQAGTGRTFEIDGSALASGIYFYRVTAQSEHGTEHTDTGRVVLVR